MELNIQCLIAGMIAGVGFAVAVFSKGNFRNVVFFAAGVFLGVLAAGHVTVDGDRDIAVLLMAFMTGLVVFAVPYIIQAEKKAEDEAAKSRTTEREDTRKVLNRIFRSPPADK